MNKAVGRFVHCVGFFLLVSYLYCTFVIVIGGQTKNRLPVLFVKLSVSVLHISASLMDKRKKILKTNEMQLLK
jgi:hypothetical protein